MFQTIRLLARNKIGKRIGVKNSGNELIESIQSNKQLISNNTTGIQSNSVIKKTRTDLNDLYYDSRHEYTESNNSSIPDKKDTEWFENIALHVDITEKPRWLQGIETSLKRKKGLETETEFEATGMVDISEIYHVLEKEMAHNITIIDVSEKCDHMEALIICEGRSKRHIYSLADAVKRLAKHRYVRDVNLPPTLSVQGVDTEDWMVVDLGRFMIHCFTPECRKEIDLEGIWLENSIHESGTIDMNELK